MALSLVPTHQQAALRGGPLWSDWKPEAWLGATAQLPTGCQILGHPPAAAGVIFKPQNKN